MIAKQRTELITGEKLFHMGNLGRCELVAGRMIPMSPTGDLHGGYESNFHYFIRSFVQAHKLGKVRVGEVGIYTGRNPDTVRGADVLFISHDMKTVSASSRRNFQMLPVVTMP